MVLCDIPFTLRLAELWPGSQQLPCVLCHPQEKSPWREAALCREAVSSTGQGKKWGISSPVHCANFGPGAPLLSSAALGPVGTETPELAPRVGKGMWGHQSPLSPQPPAATLCSGGSRAPGRTAWLHLGPQGPALEDPGRRPGEEQAGNPEPHLLMGLWGMTQIDECPCLGPGLLWFW